MNRRFAGPLMYWAGVNVIGASDDELDAFHHFYEQVHMPEVAAANNFGFTHRLAKMRENPRRSFGPDFLGVFEVPDDQAAAGFFAREDGPSDRRPAYTAGPAVWSEKSEAMWRIMWRQIWESNPSQVEPNRIRVIAMNPPEDATESEISEWSDFYSNVHAKEAIERRGWTRGTRWECERSLLHPGTACPRFFALYEAVEMTGPSDAEVAAMGPWTEGPAIWEGNVTSWALDYRRFSAIGE